MAELNGEVVGLVRQIYEWTNWRNGVSGWLQSVYGRTDLRGRGTFTAPFRELERLAAADPQVPGLRRYLEEHNSAAQEVYRRLGLGSPGHRVLGAPG